MRRIALPLLAPLLTLMLAPACALAAEPCTLHAEMHALESARFALAYRTDPTPIPAHQHFTMQVAICRKPGAAAVESLAVDATMPEHRHGMNYRPEVRANAPGRYEVTGMLFHMSGRWQLAFDVRADGHTDRLLHTVELR